MYYPGNYMNVPYMNPQINQHYPYQDYYFDRYYQYDPYLFNENYQNFQYDKKLFYSETLNRGYKGKKTKNELCYNCNNGTLPRKKYNENIIQKHPYFTETTEVIYTDFSKYLTCTMPKKKTKENSAKYKSQTLKIKTVRSNSNFGKIEKSRSKSKDTSEKTNEKIIRERVSRIEKFEIIQKPIEKGEQEIKEEKNEELNPQVSDLKPPPPPPPPPLDLNLFKSNPISLGKKNKFKTNLTDETASKSFDAVVNELKIKLNKIRPPEETMENIENNLNQKINRITISEKSKLEEIIENNFEKIEYKEVDSGIQSRDAISKKVDICSNSSISSSSSQASKNSLNRLKNTSKSNFGMIGIFNKKKQDSILSSNSEHTTSSPNLDMNEINHRHSTLSSSNLKNNSGLIQHLENLNDSELTDDFNLRKALIESDKICQDLSSTSFNKKTNQILKKIQKRNTISSLKTNDDLHVFDESRFRNQISKSKSSLMNSCKKNLDKQEPQSCFETYDLIKIESLVDLSKKNNTIAAFSTRNLFQLEKFDLNEIKNEFKARDSKELTLKKSNKIPYSSSTLKSKSEIKIDKRENLNRDYLFRPIPKNLLKKSKVNFDDETKEELSHLEDIDEEFSDKKIPIPSKYSSFTDLTKNKQFQNVPNKNFNSLKRSLVEKDSSLYYNLLNKAVEYGIKLPDGLDELKSNYDVVNQDVDYESFNSNSYDILTKHDYEAMKECLEINDKDIEYENFNYFSNDNNTEQKEQLEKYMQTITNIYKEMRK
ncbi:unnamed protein product [Brachionus calyciflorus]|uniref:Uncharacterized protein n=1 Tax=Brachionus calyciflorus TaxID=104777 RepID=A0A813N6P6_9BILA|nr:unnamed protein product [Brachionus calyciflorus]